MNSPKSPQQYKLNIITLNADIIIWFTMWKNFDNYNFQDDNYWELQKAYNFSLNFYGLAFPRLLLLCWIKTPEIFLWEKITSSIVLTYVHESLSKFITYFPLATKRKITKEFILKKEISTKNSKEIKHILKETIKTSWLLLEWFVCKYTVKMNSRMKSTSISSQVTSRHPPPPTTLSIPSHESLNVGFKSSQV